MGRRNAKTLFVFIVIKYSRADTSRQSASIAKVMPATPLSVDDENPVVNPMYKKYPNPRREMIPRITRIARNLGVLS